MISPLQFAYVPNRNIQDNNILVYKLLRAFKNKREKGRFMFLKMDMEKAFNKMKWSLLLVVMQNLGFHKTWINWIRICIFSLTFSLLC